MVFLFVHNYYRNWGGEDAGVSQERDLLASAGHRIVEYTRHSNEIALDGLAGRARLAFEAIWSQRTLRDLRSLLAREKPDLAYFHNLLPLISPSAYFACAEAGVPVVQTLHNYRLLCPAGSLLRQGRVCEECMEHSLFRSIRYRCYHGSAAETATVALMLASQRAVGTWDARVDRYIARTEFARRKFVEGGLPADKIVVKPCFVHPDPGCRTGHGDAALFVGRLSPEKGLLTLINAWELLEGSVPLRIVGDGPQRSQLEAEVKHRGLAKIEFLGRLPGQAVLAEIKRARFLVFPSEWYEGLPLTIVESFACGVPVLASRLGSMLEIVEDGRTGLHFSPGNSEELAAKARWAWAHAAELDVMGGNARVEYQAKYTAERNIRLLTEISEKLIRSRQRSPAVTVTVN